MPIGIRAASARYSTDITLSEAAKLADLIRQEAETERGEIADEEARRDMPDKPDKNKLDLKDVHVNMIVTGVDKHPAASWTVWLAGAIAFLTSMAGESWVADNPAAILWVGYAIAALTLALRIKTRKPLRWKVKP